MYEYVFVEEVRVVEVLPLSLQLDLNVLYWRLKQMMKRSIYIM